MLKPAIACTLALFIGAAAPPTSRPIENSTSVVCVYTLLLAGHNIETGCARPLDVEREQRYSRVKLSLEAFIRANGPADSEAVFAGAARAARISDRTCPHPEADMLWQRMTEPSYEMFVRDFLATPRDPQVGICL
jgi:hypothetical protein